MFCILSKKRAISLVFDSFRNFKKIEEKNTHRNWMMKKKDSQLEVIIHMFL